MVSSPARPVRVLCEVSRRTLASRLTAAGIPRLPTPRKKYAPNRFPLCTSVADRGEASLGLKLFRSWSRGGWNSRRDYGAPYWRKPRREENTREVKENEAPRERDESQIAKQGLTFRKRPEKGGQNNIVEKGCAKGWLARRMLWECSHGEKITCIHWRNISAVYSYTVSAPAPSKGYNYTTLARNPHPAHRPGSIPIIWSR